MAVQVRASYQLKGWQGDQLKLRVSRIMQAYQTPMDQQLKTEIQTAQFDWPRGTHRRNGSYVPPGKRNIVDLGGLLRSQKRSFDGRATLTFTWDAPHAKLVLIGYRTRKTIVDGRDWIKPALQHLPLDKFFAEQWRRLENKGA